VVDKGGGLKRNQNCGELRRKDIGKEVVLTGWLQSTRDHGGLIFIDLRDRSGIAQIVFDPQREKSSHREAKDLRSEYVLAVKGKVRERPRGTENPNLPTGEVEVIVQEVEVLNKSRTPPFEIFDETGASEEIRLKYRYIDLRRPPMQRNILFRHRAALLIRNFLDKKEFLEVETPMLTRSTPEGARDYLVPSRVSPGSFYALPQSPQLFKQLLMVGGIERYFQLARCFRDEDLRKDRQPEHTQIDMELSFVEEEDIYSLVEGLMAHLFENLLKLKVETPFPRLTYAETMAKFGTDKPDLRFGMEIGEVSERVKESQFKIFKEAVSKGGCVRGFSLPGGGKFSRKELDDLVTQATKYGAKGLAWLKVKEEGKADSPIAKFFTPEELKGIASQMKAKSGDLIVLVADKAEVAGAVLGQLRLDLAGKLDLPKKGEYKFTWITDFPLFEYSEEEKRPVSMHHPFCMPREEDLKLLESEPLKVRARTYDLVLNGEELGTGSIRVHRRKIQEKIFKCLKISSKEAQEKFGFLLEAFQYGAPPHGGIALGLDRILMIMSGSRSIREVIAFPKTQKAVCLLTRAPSMVDERQLKELNLSLTNLPKSGIIKGKAEP
jgi:aspartyl-tRNA synthetase